MPDDTAGLDTGVPGRSLRHELRTPLNQIIGYAEMLQEEAAEIGQTSFVDDLKKIEKAGRRLLSLVNELTLTPGRIPLSDPVPRLTTETVIRDVVDAESRTDPALQTGLSETILVVDDSEENRDLLMRRLQSRGFTVKSAAGGREALAMLESQSFDLVLLDVMMPEVSGMDVLRTIRRRRPMSELPVIMATARDASSDMVQALRAGANDYVTKPLDFAVVLARVDTQLSLKRARDQVQQLNRRLDNAQRQISRLVDSSPDAMRDVAGWSRSILADICTAIHAQEIVVWVLENDVARSLSPTRMPAPSLAEFRHLRTAAGPVRRKVDMLVPVLGLSGEIFGALVVRGDRTLTGEVPERVLASFARQLGGTLELNRMRSELQTAAQRNRASRQQLLEKGVELARICPSCRRCFHHKTDHCDTDGSELNDFGLVPYRIAGRYRLTSVLGEGGMATVFATEDERLSRQVAVKIVKREFFNNDMIRQRFDHEARAVARIGHPGVVTVFDSGELDDGSYFIVMERLHGRDLSSVIRAIGPGTPAQVATVLRQASAALGAAHRARLMHRDIKPENLFLSPAPGGFTLKVVDFGVAKEMNTESHLTQTGTVVGTPLFMSPEQILCKPVDTRCDIYSLAAVGFLALTGRRVTRGDTFPAILLEMVHGQHPRLSSVLIGVPPAVDDAFAAALSIDPDKRPSDIEAWTESFVDVLDQMPSPARGWLSASGELDLVSDAASLGLHGSPTTNYSG
jgi:CheY-like chemotaxis protein/tRNA A-37 threonylcarbamoyl transferase component Bud32